MKPEGNRKMEGIKVAVSSYSFSSLVNKRLYNPLTLIEKAKEMGFDAIEYAELKPHDGSSILSYAEKLRKEAERVGLPISNFCFGADFLNGSDGNTEAEITRVKAMIDAAETMGVKSVRHDATQGSKRFRTFELALPVLAEACREVTQYAQEKGIRTMVENHGFYCQDSLRVEKLVGAINHPNFGLLVDMGNFLCADEDPHQAVSRVAPLACYAHAKDFHVKSAAGPNPGRGFFKTRGGTYLRGAIVGHGAVPVKACLSALKQSGFTGYVSLEFEGIEDAEMAIAIGAENIRRYLGELEQG